MSRKSVIRGKKKPAKRKKRVARRRKPGTNSSGPKKNPL